MKLRSLSAATLILIIAAVSLSARLAQSTSLENKVVSEYNGNYSCAQGMTDLTIQFLKPEAGSQAVAIFRFGPPSENQSIPSGAFLLAGIADLSGGKLDLYPLSWISRPSGYSMVALSGTSSDGGVTFDGTVEGFGCTVFSIRRVSISSAGNLAAPAAPMTAHSQRRTKKSEIPLRNLSGIFVVPVSINGALTLDFMIDSGASDVTIPADVVLTLIRTGTLRDTDFLGQKTYTLADGQRYRLKPSVYVS